jgi:hypothetical protein
LTTLPEAVASAERVLARQDGPTVLAGHPFSGNDRHRSRRASERLGACLCGSACTGRWRGLHGLGQDLSDAAGIGRDRVRRDEGRLSEEAFLRDFAGDLPEARAKVLYAVQQPF